LSMRQFSYLAIGIFLSFSTLPAVGDNPPDSDVKLDSSPSPLPDLVSAKNFATNALVTLAKNPEAPPPILTFTFYASVDCNAPNGRGCSGNAQMEAFDGFQICRSVYAIAVNSGPITSQFAADRWETVDPLEPAGFRRYTLTMTASGGSHLRYENVGLIMLPDDTTADERHRLGCDILQGPTP
jgi:hypothetical protein